MIFRHTVDQFCADGVDFRTHVYVPEIDPVTGKTHHDRCDHGHLLKRIAGTYVFLDNDILPTVMEICYFFYSTTATEISLLLN